MDNIDEVIDKTIKVLKDIEKDKAQVARPNNKKVKNKSSPVKTGPGRFGKPA